MKKTHTRPSWDDYFMQVTNAIAERATCDRGRSGCVIVKDRQILASGYVGAPPGLPHCDEAGHLYNSVIHTNGEEKQHCVRTVHAEQNAICQAAKRGIALDGASLYCRMTPCRTCAMLIISCGITRILCQRKYHAGAESEDILAQAGVIVEFVHEEVQPYN